MVPLVLLTLGLLAQQASASGTFLHTVGIIDVVLATIGLLVLVVVMVAKIADPS